MELQPGCTGWQGKYLENGGPKEARLNKYRGRYAEAESRYGAKANTVAAVRAYVQLAREAAMSPVELAIRCSLTVCRQPLTIVISVFMEPAGEASLAGCWML